VRGAILVGKGLIEAQSRLVENLQSTLGHAYTFDAKKNKMKALESLMWMGVAITFYAYLGHGLLFAVLVSFRKRLNR